MNLAKSIVKSLGGNWYGTFGCVQGPGHSRRDRSLTISPNPNDPDDVIVHSFAGDDWREVKQYLRDRGLLSPNFYSWRPQPLRQAATEPEDIQKDENRINYANRIWREGQPVENSLTQHYLMSRGIKLNLVASSLHHHPGLKHGPTETFHPAMIAAVSHAGELRITGLLRTYLKSDGSGKAEVDPAKMSIGRIRGAGVWLGKVGHTVAITEGVETGLTYQQETGIPAVAVLSANNLSSLVLPDDVRQIYIVADNDENGVGIREAKKAADIFADQGRDVAVVLPRVPGDFNDVIQRHPL